MDDGATQTGQSISETTDLLGVFPHICLYELQIMIIKREHILSGSPVGENDLLMVDVSGEQPHC